MEPVPEQNVWGDPNSFYGFTSPLPNGSWFIQYNLTAIQQNQLAPEVMIFLFYHECAHAQFASADEAVADCGALRAMDTDGYLTERGYALIEQAYARRGRRFPSGIC